MSTPPGPEPPLTVLQFLMVLAGAAWGWWLLGPVFRWTAAFEGLGP